MRFEARTCEFSQRISAPSNSRSRTSSQRQSHNGIGTPTCVERYGICWSLTHAGYPLVGRGKSTDFCKEETVMKLRRISTVGALLVLALQSIAVLSLGLSPHSTALAQQQQPPPQPADQGGGLNVDVDINDDDSAVVWYGQWWVWAIGVGVFLVVII